MTPAPDYDGNGSIRLVYDAGRPVAGPGALADLTPPPAAADDDELVDAGLPADEPDPAPGPAEPGAWAGQAQDAADTTLAWMARFRTWLAARRDAVKKWAGDGHSTAAARDGVSIWDARPPSLRQLAAYTRGGGWVPGDKPAPLEFTGWLYGWFIVALSAVFYALLHIWQRPGRLILAAGVLAIVILAYPH